ncbi:hypothetical protein CIY_31670 [Butyrivibrio fibrisolvens 16/4]|nr:hypothetical protein CIY_31670 [Butyrivibrio fibrisolvens 16/4]
MMTVASLRLLKSASPGERRAESISA